MWPTPTCPLGTRHPAQHGSPPYSWGCGVGEGAWGLGLWGHFLLSGGAFPALGPLVGEASAPVGSPGSEPHAASHPSVHTPLRFSPGKLGSRHPLRPPPLLRSRVSFPCRKDGAAQRGAQVLLGGLRGLQDPCWGSQVPPTRPLSEAYGAPAPRPGNPGTPPSLCWPRGSTGPWARCPPLCLTPIQDLSLEACLPQS